MLSFFSEPCLKEAVIARVKEHQRLDQIIQGTYWDGTRGCAIGCVLHSGEHMAYETQLGLPVFLAYMDEHIFEHLPLDEAKRWPLRFIEAVPVGMDLELVFPRFMHWLLSDPAGMRRFANHETLLIINTLVPMYARRIDGVPFDATSARAARAAEAAAWAAAGAADEAAEAAAWAAGVAGVVAAEAAGAADEAAVAAAWAAAEAAGATEATIHRQADYLITLLQSYESTSAALGVVPCEERLWLPR